MNNQKYYLLDKKYGYEQFDLITQSMMNPEIKCNPNAWYALDRMPVSLAWGLNIDIHPTFSEQLGIQVSREVERILGIKGLQKWWVNIELFKSSEYINEGKPINFDGFSYYQIALVTKQASWYSIWIRWKSLKDDGSYIALNDEVFAETIKFEVCEELPPCPITKLLPKIPTAKWATYIPPAPPTTESVNRWKYTLPLELHPLIKRKKEKTGFTFDIEIFNPGWPDVILEIALDEATKENILDCIQEFINNWNDESESKKREPFIHYANIIDSNENGHITIAIDFGSCSPLKPLNRLFEWLNNSDISINHIIVK